MFSPLEEGDLLEKADSGPIPAIEEREVEPPACSASFLLASFLLVVATFASVQSFCLPKLSLFP